MMKGRRTGSVIAWGEKKWRLRWYRGEENGKRRYSSEVVEAPNKREAEKVLREKMGQADRGEFVEPTRETFGEYLERWLMTAAAQKVRKRTLADYRYTIEHYVTPKLGPIRLQALRTSDLQGMVGDLVAAGLSPRSIRIVHRVISAALEQAVRWQELMRNPAGYVDLPAGKSREMRALTSDAVARLRAALTGTHFSLLFDLLLLTGMRPSEALGLRWADVDLDAGEISVRQVLSRRRGRKNGEQVEKSAWEFTAPKTEKSRRTLPLLSGLVAGLRAHRAAQAERRMKHRRVYAETHDLVFATRLGQPIVQRNVVRSFKAALERAGLPSTLRVYDLRHTTASLMLAAGEQVRVVADQLGHASATMTLNVYAHAMPNARREASERLGLLVFSARAADARSRS